MKSIDYELIHGDCLIEMDNIPDGSIDMILCDPPYGTTSCSFDVRIPFEPLWAQYKRVIKKRGAIVLFGASPFNYMLWASNPERYKHNWIWIKSKCGNFQLAEHQPLKYSEDILVFGFSSVNYYPIFEQANPLTVQRRKYAFNGKPSGIQHMASGNYEYKDNKDVSQRYPKNILYFESVISPIVPTQKPVALLEYLIKTYTNPGELVLDNTAGSFSTGEAALRTGRRFIGIEKDANYYNIGTKRMERVAAELRGEFVPKAGNGKLEDLPMFQEGIN